MIAFGRTWLSTDVVSAPGLLRSPVRIGSTLESSLRAIVAIVPPLLATSVGVLLRDAGYQVLSIPPGALAGVAGAGGLGFLAAAVPRSAGIAAKPAGAVSGSGGGASGPEDFDIAVVSALLPGAEHKAGFVVLPLRGLLRRQARAASDVSTLDERASSGSSTPTEPTEPTAPTQAVAPPHAVAPPQAVVVTSVHDLLRTLDQLRRSLARRAGPLQPL
jgi:hypothetical protein